MPKKQLVTNAGITAVWAQPMYNQPDGGSTVVEGEAHCRHACGDVYFRGWRLRTFV